jgi:2-oxoglutarate/2-oxoacid ferredoxin oxidoreductase subunit beta
MSEAVQSVRPLHPLVSKYLRNERMPHMACPGCGIGQVVHATLLAIDDLGLSPRDTVWVQGVGCSSRITYSLWAGDNVDAHHGRIFAVATGLKMARPDMHFILFTGDGDCGAIGGNHFIHACRRNLDVTAILFNNGIYGMTGGQVAPTSGFGAVTTTTPYGNLEDPFDMCELAITAGASYVARWKSTDFKSLAASIKKGVETKGLAFIEVLVQCPTNFGRYTLKTSQARQVLKWIQEHAIPVKEAEKVNPEERRGKFVIGELIHRTDRSGIVERYQEFLNRYQKEER